MQNNRNKAFGLAKSQTYSKANSEKPFIKHHGRAIIASILRLVLLDALPFLILLTYASLSWVHHVSTHYLTKQIEAATWDAHRHLTDQCYYYRYCNAKDISTNINATDLYLSPEASPQDAYQHQLQHGFTVFPHVLSRDTATNLRNFVISKNQNLTKDEEIWLISNGHRWSFPLGCEEERVVLAVKEVVSNKRLKETMQLLLGDDPAMIELTAITSAFGAGHQEFHHDGITSLGQYAQGVSHSYSIFIMLQDTTPAMGATGACPGTAKCADGLEQVCEEHGLQPQNSQGFWGTGDALVMNMDSWHRGSAHTDPDGADRVMLCVTFTSRPRDWGETRQLPHGISYSIRWDHYGFTWKDLERAETTLVPPMRRVLKSLGLYKRSSENWGVDFPSSACMRIANKFMGFTNSELKDFRKRGGFQLLPESLQGEGNSWQDFLMETLLHCKEFAKHVCVYFVAGYLVLCLFGMVLCRRFSLRGLFDTVVRLAVIGAVVLAMYVFAVDNVDKSQWAFDLKNGLRYTSPFSFKELDEYTGPLAYPHRNDVLIATRFKSRYLFAYNDYIGSHPGNQVWNELLEDKISVFASYSELLPVFRQAVAEYIVSGVHENSGRFLYQHPKSHWVEISDEDAMKVTREELTIKSNGILRNVIEELDFLISDAKYGPLRTATMTDNDIFPYLLDLKDLLLTKSHLPLKVEAPKGEAQFSVVTSKLPSPPKALSSEIRSCRFVSLPVGKVPHEPEPNAWLRSGDVVSVREGKHHDRKAKLKAVTSSGESIVQQYLKEGRDLVSFKNLMRYVPPKVGEQVDVMMNGSFRPGVIIKEVSCGMYDVSLNDGGILENTSDDVFRRYANVTQIT